MIDESLLHRMQRAVLGSETFDRGDGSADRRRERQTGEDPPAADKDGAGAALAVVAALFAPVRPRCSRNASSKVVRGSSSSWRR